MFISVWSQLAPKTTGKFPDEEIKIESMLNVSFYFYFLKEHRAH